MSTDASNKPIGLVPFLSWHSAPGQDTQGPWHPARVLCCDPHLEVSMSACERVSASCASCSLAYNSSKGM